MGGFMKSVLLSFLLASFFAGCGSSSSDDSGGGGAPGPTSTGATTSTGTGTSTGTTSAPFVFSCMEGTNHCRNYHCSGTCDAWMAKKQSGCEAPSTEPCNTEGAVQKCTVTLNVNGALTTAVDLYYAVSSTRESACDAAGGTFETP
jgi:hypothetical protein